MPVLDTPITANDQGLKKVLGRKQPAVILLFDGHKSDAPLQDALKKAAKKHADDLLVIKVDVSENPDTHAQYGHLQTPAVVTLTEANFGRNIKSKAEGVRPSDLRAHIDHLLKDKPLPQPKPQQTAAASSGKPVNVTDQSFRKVVLQSKTPVLVDFWAEWCGPCHMIAPHLEQLAGEYAGKITIAKLNIDQNRKTAMQYNVSSIPNMLLFEGGQVVDQVVGANAGAVRALVQRAAAGR